MEASDIIDRISKGRTDLIFRFLQLNDWQSLLHNGPVRLLQWLVYYNDTTALKAVLEGGGDLSSININEELGHAAFFGHWKVCDFLINHGADPNTRVLPSGETPLHNALAKAGRPYYVYTVRLLVERGADVNVKTLPGHETGAFMRDVRTKGETPLHRAAAYADEETIRYLISRGAEISAKDSHGDSPLTWASEHLRPGTILSLLQYGDYRISESHMAQNTSDHGNSWGNAMDWKLFGEYLPD